MKKHDKNSKPDDLDFNKLKDLRHNKIKAWTSERFKLKYPQFYSKELKEILNHHFQAIIEYLQGNSLRETAIKYNLTKRILTRITRDTLNRKSMEELLRSIIGNQGELGLELAVADLKVFYFENKSLPKTKQEGMITIRNAIHTNNHWEDFGINSWDDLLVHAFGEEKIKELRDLDEKNLFDKAISELNASYNKKSKLPKFQDKETYWIGGAVTRGIWQKFGIYTWNDLLKQVFGKINLEHNIYEGIEGLNKAKEELQNYYEKYKKLPTSKDFDSIRNTITRNAWKQYGILKWNDLLFNVFGEVNLTLKNFYTNSDSLILVQNQLKSFKEKNRRLPKSTDLEMSSIKGAVSRGVFKEKGILTWNNLLMDTFGEKNRVRSIYSGNEGLKRAVQEIKDFKRKYGREPIVRDADVIYRTAKRGEWKEFGIDSWDELLITVFGKSNLKKYEYSGREGLERAIKRLRDFKEKNNKKPTSRDRGMFVIYNVIGKGEWKDFNIDSWNDLLMHTFGEIHCEINKYKGKEGLERAVQELKNYKNKNGRKPSQHKKGMGGISHAIQRGEWKEFGIDTWNDLLFSIFGEIYYEKNKHQGKRGLENAIQKLKDFEKNHKRIPKLRDEGMRTISSAITRGMWRDFGINTWNDLLNRVFGEINKDINKYSGAKGYELAVQELKEFKKKYNKLPTSRSKGITSIYTVIRRGEWKKFGITSWNDLLYLVFEEFHFEINKYKGKKGLEKAKSEMLAFYKKNDKKPTSRIGGFNRIYKFIQKGEWTEFGISTWNDLLMHIFGEINIETNKYIGNKGLNRAIRELGEFEKKFGKKPILKNKGMRGICSAIRRGKWKEFGIITWNDLLKRTFGEINKERNKYIGSEGLDRAVKELREFKKRHGKKPSSISKGIYTIYNTARYGKWTEFGINTWNDLLRSVFGEVNATEKDRYKGKTGLDKAIKELKMFKKKYNKKPTSKSKGFYSIYTAARLGKWGEYGIANWNDLLNHSFYPKDTL